MRQDDLSTEGESFSTPDETSVVVVTQLVFAGLEGGGGFRVAIKRSDIFVLFFSLSLIRDLCPVQRWLERKLGYASLEKRNTAFFRCPQPLSATKIMKRDSNRGQFYGRFQTSLDSIFMHFESNVRSHFRPCHTTPTPSNSECANRS